MDAKPIQEIKPVLRVGAYFPKDETSPVLIPIISDEKDGSSDLFAGYAARKGDMLYDALKLVCEGKPKWLFGSTPVEI